MKFLHKTYEAKKKEIIEVEIDKPTKVKFLTAKEYKAYTQARTHSYHGGLYEESPVRFVVPYDANWNVVVEKGTLRNPVELHAACRLTMPNSTVRTSVAVDAPQHVKELAAAEDVAESAAEEEN